LLGARSKKSALDFISKQKGSEQFYYFSTIYKGAPWHVVIYGEFANRDIANSAIKKLPSELRKMRPWARSVRGVQIDIKKK
jgi:septal ring-binding cell division protein DamX